MVLSYSVLNVFILFSELDSAAFFCVYFLMLFKFETNFKINIYIKKQDEATRDVFNRFTFATSIIMIATPPIKNGNMNKTI